MPFKLFAALSAAALAGSAVLTDRHSDLQGATAEREFPPTGQFIEVNGRKVHVVVAGEGPDVVLIHGAGGATHSWRHLIPLLTDQFRVVAIDLPGQGFTKLGAQRRCGLDQMSEDIVTLCTAENFQPSAIIGHSTGAAIALRMAELWQPNPPTSSVLTQLLNRFLA